MTQLGNECLSGNALCLSHEHARTCVHVQEFRRSPLALAAMAGQQEICEVFLPDEEAHEMPQRYRETHHLPLPTPSWLMACVCSIVC